MFRQRLSLLAARTTRVAVARPAFALRVAHVARPAMASMLSRGYATEPSTSDLSSAASELSAILRQERRIELESAESTLENDNEYFESYLKSTGFVVKAEPGKDEVELVRETPSGETVRVFFSTSDVLNNAMDLDDASAQADDAARAADADVEEEQLSPEEDLLVSPVRLNIVLEKPNGSAISVEALAKDDELVLESVVPYPTAKLAVDESAEADYIRRQLYMGPPFSALDPAVQTSFYQYLEERAVDADLASFVNDYASHRENNEYVLWLSKLADFIEA